MKVVLALCLAFVATVYGTASFMGMVATTNQLTLTATNPSTASNFAIVGLTSTPASYKGDRSGEFVRYTFNVTWSGNLPDAVSPSAVLTLSDYGYSSGGDASCTLIEPISVDGNHFFNAIVFEGLIAPYYTQATSVTGTINLQLVPGVNLGVSQTFTFNAVAPFYVAPAAPTLPTALSFVAPTTFVTSDDFYANVSIGSTTANFYSVELVFSGPDPEGVAWVASCVINAVAATGTAVGGWCNILSSWNFQPQIGSWCGNTFSGSSIAVDFPKGATFTLKSVTVAKSGASQSWAGSASPFNSASVTVSSGVVDNTAPTCTVATFATPLAITTTNTPTTNTMTITCTDGTGTGIAYGGVFLRAVAGSLTYDYSASNTLDLSAPLAYVPLYYSGTVSVLGVWRIDNNGNAVVYGQCIAGSEQTLCGGSGGSGSSSSSAVVASISLVIALILAVLAL